MIGIIFTTLFIIGGFLFVAIAHHKQKTVTGLSFTQALTVFNNARDHVKMIKRIDNDSEEYISVEGLEIEPQQSVYGVLNGKWIVVYK